MMTKESQRFERNLERMRRVMDQLDDMSAADRIYVLAQTLAVTAMSNRSSRQTINRIVSECLDTVSEGA